MASVVGRQIYVVGSVNAAFYSTILIIADTIRLVGLAVGHIAPKNAVVVFVVPLLVIDAADAFCGEVHHDVAVVGGEFASCIHGTGIFGGVVVEDAVFEDGLRIIIKVYAAAFGRCGVVADAAVGIVGSYAIANAAAHGSSIVSDGAVIEVDVGSASRRIDVDAAAKHSSVVVFESAVG